MLRTNINYGVTSISCVKQCGWLSLEIIFDASGLFGSFDNKVLDKWLEDCGGTTNKSSIHFKNTILALAKQ